ncbi:hypothetical protein ACMXYQ_05065 [Neptuniibacter sp. PT34_22]|uniref:hypothetical protein n=1 Tax=Neptuniibacter sp. PT34_22 TaxID=3398205 RepID=UPI0039F4F5AD
MGFSVFFDKGSRELVCFDGEGGVKGIVESFNFFSPKACFYNDCFYEFLESEIVITSLNETTKKIDLPTNLGRFSYIYYFYGGAYLKLYVSGGYNIYKFDYQKHTVDEVFFSKNKPSEITSFNGKEYFLSGGNLYSINAGEVTEIEKDVGDNFIVVSNGVFFFKKYHSKISYIDSDDSFYSVSLPEGFFVASIIPSYGNLSAIQITTASGYEAFGIIPISNLYINDMKDFFSLSNISMIEESGDLVAEEQEADRGAVIRLNIRCMDIFTAAQFIAGLTFNAFYKYCNRYDLAGNVFYPESDKEIDGLFVYHIDESFSESDRGILTSIVEEIFSYYLENKIVYLDDRVLRYKVLVGS